MTGNGPSVYTDQINSAADLEITGILDESNEGPARTRLEDALRSCITICESYFSGKITKREAVTQCREEMSQCTSYIEATKVGLERKQREREELERKEQEKNLLMEREAIVASLKICEEAEKHLEVKRAEITGGG